MSFQNVDKGLLFSKNDIQDPRLGEFVNKSENACISVIGYPDDEGIKNNGGRLGASQGPNKIRQYLYRMTPPFLSPQTIQIQDHGNLELNENLNERHSLAEKKVQNLFQKSHILTLGGGHDYAYPDGSAFIQSCKDSKLKPLVINFDAHLDVRPFKNQIITSGTPFYRLLDTYKNQFDLLEIGIQSQCNSSFHYEWALKNGVYILSYEELQMSGDSFTTKTLQFLEPHILKRRPTFLSIDMDFMSSAFAPGCSQVFATGFTPFDFMPVLKVILKRLNVKIMGIYETSPVLDTDDRTSKLAAQFAYEFIFANN